MNRDSAGTLYVVGTPIGNLDDLSPRARRVLGAVDLIAAEDTRRTRGLLSSIGVVSSLISHHEHNEERETPRLIQRLEEGASIALVSDAGTPAISDPGMRLVRAALEAGVEVLSVPGPSAVVAALAVCGLATDRFVFEGFLPRRPGARRERLQPLRSEARTMVFFESVHRLAATLSTLEEAFGANRPAVIARELTKVHEKTYRGSLGTLRNDLGSELPLKGEFVIIVAGREHATEAGESEAERVFELLSRELPAKTAVAMTAEITGLSRNRVYRITRVDES